MCVCYHVFLENISLHFSTRMSRGKYYNGPKEIQLPSKLLCLGEMVLQKISIRCPHMCHFCSVMPIPITPNIIVSVLLTDMMDYRILRWVSLLSVLGLFISL